MSDDMVRMSLFKVDDAEVINEIMDHLKELSESKELRSDVMDRVNDDGCLTVQDMQDLSSALRPLAMYYKRLAEGIRDYVDQIQDAVPREDQAPVECPTCGSKLMQDMCPIDSMEDFELEECDIDPTQVGKDHDIFCYICNKSFKSF